MFDNLLSYNHFVFPLPYLSYQPIRRLPLSRSSSVIRMCKLSLHPLAPKTHFDIISDIPDMPFLRDLFCPRCAYTATRHIAALVHIVHTCHPRCWNLAPFITKQANTVSNDNSASCTENGVASRLPQYPDSTGDDVSGQGDRAIESAATGQLLLRKPVSSVR